MVANKAFFHPAPDIPQGDLLKHWLVYSLVIQLLIAAILAIGAAVVWRRQTSGMSALWTTISLVLGMCVGWKIWTLNLRQIVPDNGNSLRGLLRPRGVYSLSNLYGLTLPMSICLSIVFLLLLGTAVISIKQWISQKTTSH
jgi:hypothetical protein